MGHLVRPVAYALVLFGYLIGLYGGIGYDAWMALHGCEGHPCGLWQDTVRKSPNKARPHVNLGYAYAQKGQLGRALTEYQKAELLILDNPDARERDQRHILILMNMSTLYITAQRWTEAREILKEGFLTYPHFPGFAANLAVCYLHLGEPEKAVAFLEDAEPHIGKDYPWFVNTSSFFIDKALAYQQLGRCADMHRTFETQVWRDPDTQQLPEFECKERN